MVLSRKCLAGLTVLLVLTGCGTQTDTVKTNAPSGESLHLDELAQHEAERIYTVAYAAFGRAVATAVAYARFDNAVRYAVAVAEVEAERAREREQERDADRQTEAAPEVEYVSTPGTGQCGGDLPSCCIMNRESGGSLTAENPNSTASGKWQFVDGTWNNFMGYAHASDAPEWVQDEKARQTWAGGDGRSHWQSTDGSC